MRYATTYLFALALVAIPSLVFAGTDEPPPAPTFQREGVFDCNPNGAFVQSVGALTATGGIYVPVADATVELNTGILVYKECTLREIVDRMREGATSAFTKQMVQAIQTARGGSAQYVVNQGKEELDIMDKERLNNLQNGTLEVLNPGLRAPVTRYAARSYMSTTRNSNAMLNCTYAGGDVNQVIRGRPADVWSGLNALMQPTCYPIYAGLMTEDYLSAREASALYYQSNQWNWGRGFYPVVTSELDPLMDRTLTPAAVVQESFQQVIGTGFRQLEAANDVGQMVGALFAGMSTHIIADTGGLAGVMQTFSGQPSYLDQVAAESASGLRNAAANAGLQILAAARAVEAAYLGSVSNMADTLRQTIGKLRNAENACWNLIIPKVCSTAMAADNTCTANSGAKLKVATSTAFSQPLINTNIAPLATPVATNVTNSTNAMRLIDGLIAGLTNTSSLNAQRIALQQLDSLVAQKRLHTKQDLETVRQQEQDVNQQMSLLVDDTVRKWADDPVLDPGWCNINNSAVIDFWTQQWTI